MKTLITGATGCVGSALLEDIKGEVRIFSRHDVKGHETIIGDITDEKKVEQAVKGCDIIYHLAGLVEYGRSKEKLGSVNIKGTENVLKACRNQEIDRLIFTSSVAVYANETMSIIDENTTVNPSSEYGRSKYQAELMITGQKEVPYTILRPAPVYGPKSKQFSYLIRKINSGKLSVIGDGENKNHLVNSKNLAQALVLAQKKEAKNEVFVIADSEARTAREIYAIITDLLGVEQKKPIPYWQAYLYALYNEAKGKELNREYLKAIIQHREYSIKKAEELLEYRPAVGLEQGMRELVEWCRKEGII